MSDVLPRSSIAYVRSNLDFPERDPKSSTVIITGAFTLGGLANFPQGRIEQLYQFQDVATYTTGRNSFKFADLCRRLGIPSINETTGIGRLGADAPRIQVANCRGPWQEVAILGYKLSELQTPAFRQFLDDHIYGVRDFAEYLDLCGGLRRLQQLRQRELLLHLGK